ncbi:MAG: patatin-like phospholipase family protein [Bacteroidetes bacterium]|nr:patatin-like phospholipase family protein [Bacteroidota bacterium]
MKNVQVCLSGGGARGFAHLGVVEALKEMGIEISRYSGTSAGAMAGAF